MSNLSVRILFAIFAIPALLAALWSGDLGRWLVFLSILSIGSWEFVRMLREKIGGPDMRILMPVAVVILGLLRHSAFGNGRWIELVSALLVPLFILVAFRKVELPKIFPWLASQLFGLWFFGLFVSAAHTLWTPEQGFHAFFPLLFALVSMWVIDTGSYFSGKSLGRRKLCPEISPKKTWEGAVGGAVLLLLFTWFFGPVLLVGLSRPSVMLLALLLSVVAPIGDLFMSTLKRYTGFKDSSHVFPGHGGMLDRMDSFLLSAPLVAAWVSYTRASL